MEGMLPKVKHEDKENITNNQEGSPTIKNILEGNSKIAFYADSFEVRNILGKEYSGHAYTYEMTVPHPIQEGQVWTTWITVWHPSTIYKNDPNIYIPEMQMTITTGQGEMSLSNNKKIVEKVLEEIHRQVSAKDNDQEAV